MTSWTATPAGCSVTTSDPAFHADRLIITCGSWSSRILQPLLLPLTVVRKVLFWLDVENPAPFRPGAFPIFAADAGASEIYGFRSMDFKA